MGQIARTVSKVTERGRLSLRRVVQMFAPTVLAGRAAMMKGGAK